MDLVERPLNVGGTMLRLLLPPDAEALLDEHAFEQEEYLPYWAELWPSALALAHFVGPRALRGARTLELGCGLGLPSLAAAIAGGRVLATDWSPESVAMTARNAERNGLAVETLRCSWTAPEPLLPLLPRLVAPRGEVWLAEPGRPPAAAFLAAAEEVFAVERRPARELPQGGVYRLRLRSPR